MPSPESRAPRTPHPSSDLPSIHAPPTDKGEGRSHRTISIWINLERVCVTTVILAPGAWGGGLRAALLDTTSLSEVAGMANSKKGQNATIRVTSELARSEDPFVRCACCGVGKGPGAPVHTRASRNQFSSEKHIRFGRLFFFVSHFCRTEPNALFLQ